MYWNPGNLPNNRILLLFQVLKQKALYNKVTMGTARTSELSLKPVQKNSDRESPSRVIFNYAYRRILNHLADYMGYKTGCILPTAGRS